MGVNDSVGKTDSFKRIGSFGRIISMDRLKGDSPIRFIAHSAPEAVAF